MGDFPAAEAAGHHILIIPVDDNGWTMFAATCTCGVQTPEARHSREVAEYEILLHVFPQNQRGGIPTTQERST